MRCAVKLHGQFDATGTNPWAIPQVGRDCTPALTRRMTDYWNFHLNSDTIAESAFVNICVYIYYTATGPVDWTRCGTGWWQVNDL